MSTLLTKSLTAKSVAEALGVAAGLLLVSVAGILLGAFVIQWILSSCGIYQATYAQVVGALAIWEIIKPRMESK